MNELQNLILNSVKNPSYFEQLNINDLIDDENIKDELLNILQIIVTNSTKQSNKLKNYVDDLNINLENKINDINNIIKEMNNKLIQLDVTLSSYISKLESNKVIETVQSNFIRIAILEKDLKLAQSKYDRIFLENIFIPNLISPKGAKFRNLKELINYNYQEIGKLYSIFDKFKKDFEDIKENHNNKANFIVMNKIQDIIEQKIKMSEDKIRLNFKEYKNEKEEIEKKNESNFDQLRKKNIEFIETLNNMKIKFEDNFNLRFNNEHQLIESQIINIKQLRDFRKEYIKKQEKLEQFVENQRVLIQKYIRYFELYKYRENFYFQKDNFNRAKSLSSINVKSKRIRENKINTQTQKITIDQESKIRLSFNEENKGNNFKNNSFEINNIETSNLNKNILINEKKNYNNLEIEENNNSSIKSNIILNKIIEKDREEKKEDNIDKIKKENKEEIKEDKKEENKEDNIPKKKEDNKDENKEIKIDKNIGNILSSSSINNFINLDNLIITSTNNNFNFQKNLTESNILNENNSKIKLKKVNFNHQKLKKIIVNNQNTHNNYLDYNYNINNYNNKINLKTINNNYLNINNKIKDDKYKLNNISYESKLNNDNLFFQNNNNANDSSSHFTIDNYIENKFRDIKNEKGTYLNNSIINTNDLKKTKENNLQRKRFFKLNIIKFDKSKDNNINEDKKSEKKSKINIKFKIESKSLPYKHDKKEKYNIYDFNNSDYVKIIEGNKIKRVNTEKKFNIHKKNN